MPTQPSTSPENQVLLARLRAKLDRELSRHLFDIVDTRMSGMTVSPLERERLRSTTDRVAAKTLRRTWRRELTPQQREQMVSALVSERVGCGPLDPLLEDSSVSEIMVNGPSQIYVERYGRIERTGRAFHDRDQLLTVIERILAPAGRQISVAEPYTDVRLADGSRVNVTVPPVAPEGPYVTIRKFFYGRLSLDHLVRLGTLSPQAEQWLRLCVRGRVNIVISGSASAGKTTLLNALANSVPLDERIVLVEEIAELWLPRHHVVRMETRPPGLEGRGAVTLRQLLKNALHMRPDRLLVGEVRDEAALDLLQTMNVGYGGSMTTLHADSPSDVINRIAVMALLSDVGLAPDVVKEQIRSAVDLIVHMERFSDGTRHVTHISEVGRGERELTLRDLFRLKIPAPSGDRTLLPTGERPALLERLREHGMEVPDPLFDTVA